MFLLQQSVLLQDNSVCHLPLSVCVCLYCPSRGWVAQGQVMFYALYLLILSVSICFNGGNRCPLFTQHTGAEHIGETVLPQ